MIVNELHLQPFAFRCRSFPCRVSSEPGLRQRALTLRPPVFIEVVNKNLRVFLLQNRIKSVVRTSRLLVPRRWNKEASRACALALVDLIWWRVSLCLRGWELPRCTTTVIVSGFEEKGVSTLNSLCTPKTIKTGRLMEMQSRILEKYIIKPKGAAWCGRTSKVKEVCVDPALCFNTFPETQWD